MTLRSLTMAAAALLMIGTSACGGDKSTGPNGTLAGTYDLKSVNGTAPPVTVFQAGTYRVQVTDGEIDLEANNTFNVSFTVRETDVGEDITTTSICPGTYTQSGNTITFTEPETEDCGGSYVGTWSNGNTLTIDFGAGLQGVFRK